MPVSWKRAILAFLQWLRRTALAVGMIGGAQVLVSLLVWQLLFRRYPQGLSMGLTLVGFVSWFLSFMMGMGGRRMALGSANIPTRANLWANVEASKEDSRQFDRGGCGCLVFVASLIPLAIAFVLRVQADFGRGRTWSDIFPPVD